MGELSASEMRAGLELLAEVESARDLDEFAQAVLGLRRLISSDIVSYNEMNPSRRRALTIADPPEVLTPEVVEGTARHIGSHPGLQHYQRTGDRRALLMSELWGRREMERTPLYQEVYRLVDANFQVINALSVDPSVVVGIRFFRSSRDYSERDRALLDLLTPHLATAYRSVETRAALGDLEQALDGGGRHVILLDGADGIRHATPGSAKLLREAFGGGEADRTRLPRDLAEWVATQRRRFDGDDGPRSAVQISARHDGRRVVARFLSEQGAGAGALLLEVHALTLSPEALTELGLSPREAEVLARLVVIGVTNAEIGRRLYISPRTVRKHVENLFGKLGVQTRTAAAALAFAAANGVRRSPGESSQSAVRSLPTTAS